MQPTSLTTRHGGFAEWRDTVTRDFKKHYATYALAIFGIAFYIIFCYVPIYGLIIAFKDYNASAGIMGSTWVGFKHFRIFFQSVYFTRILKNTLLLNFYGILFGFPIPIIIALLLDEAKCLKFRRVVQTVSYLPHFISIVVACGIVVDFTSSNGIITNLARTFGSDSKCLLLEPKLFRTIYIVSDIWQEAGWCSIIYLAALAGLDSQLIEAAQIDGAGKLRQIWHITLPSIMPTIVIMFILRVGNVMSLGAEKVILLYDPVTYETADIISSYIYRKGLIENQYSFSTAVGLFNSVINCMLVFGANYLGNKYTESGLF